MAELPQDQGDLHDDSGVHSGRSSKSLGDTKNDGIADLEAGVGKMKEKMLEYECLLLEEKKKTEELHSVIARLNTTITTQEVEINSLKASLAEVSENSQKSQELLAQLCTHHDTIRKISNGPKILHPIQESQDQSRQPPSHCGNNKRMTRSTSQPTPQKQPPKPGPPKPLLSTQPRPMSPQKGQHPGSKVTGRAKSFKSSSPSKTTSK